MHSAPALPGEGLILVRAESDRIARRWIADQRPGLATRCRYVGSMRAIDGCRPAAVVYLHGWRQHPEATDISEAIARAQAKLPMPLVEHAP